MEPELIATVMESGYEDEVFFCEINGMSESMIKQVEYNARCNAVDGIDNWPEEALTLLKYDYIILNGSKDSPVELKAFLNGKSLLNMKWMLKL